MATKGEPERLRLCGSGGRKQIDRLGVSQRPIRLGTARVDEALPPTPEDHFALGQIFDLTVRPRISLRIEEPVAHIDLKIAAGGTDPPPPPPPAPAPPSPPDQ